MDMTGYLGLSKWVSGNHHPVCREIPRRQRYGILNRITWPGILDLRTHQHCMRTDFRRLAALFPHRERLGRHDIRGGGSSSLRINLAQGLLFSVYYGVIIGIQRYDVLVKINILTSLIKAGLTVLLLGNGYGLISLSMMHLGMGFASNMYGRYYCRNHVHGLEIRFGKYGSEWYGKIFSYSFKTFMMFIGQKLIYYSDSIVIGVLLGPAQVTFFVIGASLTEYMRRIVNQMTQMFTPLTSELQARREDDKIREVLTKGTKMSLIIALPISIVFLTMARVSSPCGWSEYGILSGQVLFILTIAHLFSVAQYSTQDILQGLNKHQICAVCRFVEAIANLSLSIVLIRYWGIVGVAVGTAVPHLATALFAYPYFISRVVKIDFRRYVIGSYLAPILSSIPFLACCLIIDNRFPPKNLAGFFTRVLLIMPFYLVPVWYLSIKSAPPGWSHLAGAD
jgi:O-antigen/teichoic acid export membrane protein